MAIGVLVSRWVELQGNLYASSNSAPVSALVWWIIPLAALTGGLIYAYWVTRLKSKYDNQTERSVGRYKKFQNSFKQTPTKSPDEGDVIRRPDKRESS